MAGRAPWTLLQNVWMQSTQNTSGRIFEHDPRVTCLTCTHNHGRRFGSLRGFEEQFGIHVVCERPKSGGVIGLPDEGCCHWMREPGADDE